MISKFRYLFIFLFISALQGAAQSGRTPLTGAYLGLGAYSMNAGDVFSFHTNPASLAGLKNPALGIYGEKRFLLNELNDFIFSAALLSHSGNFGIKTGFFGSGNYNETNAGLAYGRKLGQKLDIGLAFDYCSIHIASGYGSASAIGFGLGSVLHISDRLQAGLQLRNPVGAGFGKNKEEKLSPVYGFGLGYDASAKFFASLVIEKEENRPVSVNAGLQYRFIPQLLARAGMVSGTSQAWFGLGFLMKSYRFDVTAMYHPQLGISPALLLLTEFNNRKK